MKFHAEEERKKKTKKKDRIYNRIGFGERMWSGGERRSGTAEHWVNNVIKVL